MQLRPYQEEAVDAVRQSWAKHRSTLIVIPGGGGKTVIFSEITRRVVENGGRVLILAHRGELLTQAQDKLSKFGVYADIEKAQNRASQLSDVVVGSMQTMRGKRLQKWPRDHFAALVIDECHRALADTYGQILDHFETAKVLGVTATPDRGDGQGLGEVFEECAYEYDIKTAIAEGYLTPIEAQRVWIEGLDLSKVRTVAGDFNQGELAEVMEGHSKAVAEPFLEIAGERQGIVFGVSVAHAHGIAAEMNKIRPGSTEAIDGSTPQDEREDLIRRFISGDLRYISNCLVLSEGFDAPCAEVIGIARPTKSRVLYAQAALRGTRLHPGKRVCTIVDFVGNAGRHSLAGPVDVLAGRDVEDPVIDRARELVADGMEIEAALEQAQNEWDEVRIPQLAVLKWRTEELDPFLVLPDKPKGPWASDDATERQIGALKKFGLKVPPEGLTKGQASDILDSLITRSQEGLATYKQVRKLSQFGVDAKEMDFHEASRLIDKHLRIRGRAR